MGGVAHGWPERLRINALADDDLPADAAPEPGLRRGLFGRKGVRAGHLRPAAPDDWNWSDPGVGWGLVAPDKPGAKPAELVAGEHLPEALRHLVARRRGVVLRYTVDAPGGTLRRHLADGAHDDIPVAGAPSGTGDKRIPRFLMLWGGPERIPWAVQFDLQPGYFVGRLPLEGPALERYLAALASDWGGFGLRPLASVVWSVDHGCRDITRLMRKAIADPLAARLASDADLGPGLLRIGGGAEAAGRDALVVALAERRPGLVVTTSHGATSPLADPKKLAARLGVPVDAGFRLLAFAPGGEDWMPAGAVWYAHACASAGTAGPSEFLDVVAPQSRICRVLEGLGALSPRVAPLPLALLGGARPVRAFIGHVEPTFDWSLADPASGGLLTGGWSPRSSPPMCPARSDGRWPRRGAWATCSPGGRRRFATASPRART